MGDLLPLPEWAILEPNEEYHANPAISSTQLKIARASLYNYNQYMTAPKGKPTAAMVVGTIVHALILEGPDALKDAYFILDSDDGPVNPKTQKLYGRDTLAFQNWVDDHAEGRTVITPQERAMAECIIEHPDIAEIMARPGYPEVSIRTEFMGMPCQARPDRIFIGDDDNLLLFELKKTVDVNWFPKQYRDMGYEYQNSWYRTMLREVTLRPTKVLVGVVEDSPACRAALWEADPELLDACEKQNIETLDAIRRATETGVWPRGHLHGIGVLSADTIGRPRWE
jgi:hypothetical protein